MFNHDPSQYIRGIKQILISDKKRIGFLFGAGSSLAKKSDKTLTVPAIDPMTKRIVATIGEAEPKFKAAMDEIAIDLGVTNFNVETLLSNLEQKADLICAGSLNGLKKDDFDELIKEIKKNVRTIASVHKVEGCIVAQDIVEDLVHTDFAGWIGHAERKYPIEIFTTNYDLLFELGLEQKEIPYYDGFCGSLRPFFNPESVEDLSFLSKQTKLWKIHGSLGWRFDKDTEKILRVDPKDDDLLIYPSSLKYKDSKKQPYESLLDRLSNFLRADDSILITCGYSWGDEHINARIISSLKTQTTSHVIGFIYDDDTPIEIASNLCKLGLANSKISLYGSRSAVIGCKFGDWKLKSEPSNDDTISLNLYFDEDAHSDTNEAVGIEVKGDEVWTGRGKFLLPNFKNLVSFLNAMINDNEIKRLGAHVQK